MKDKLSLRFREMFHQPLLYLVLFTFAVRVYGQDYTAQEPIPKVALINEAAQLVVVSADGMMNWIVTRSDEVLHPILGYTWSQDGSLLFFAVQVEAQVSLRIGDPMTQTFNEVAILDEPVSGGDWTIDGQVRIAAESRNSFYRWEGEELFYGSTVTLISPFTNEEPHLATPSSLSPDSVYNFELRHNGNITSYESFTPGQAILPLAVTNDANAYRSGMWSDIGYLIAYWGTDIRSGAWVLGVTNTNNFGTARISSERAAMTPIAWVPNRTQLIYRDAVGELRVAEMTCLLDRDSCSSNPLEAGIILLPASASEIQVIADWVYFRHDNLIQVVNLFCIHADNCLESIVTLGTQAAPQTILHVVGDTLIYTAYEMDALNPTDREIRILDLGCLPECQPRLLVDGAIAGMLSPDERYFVADIIGIGLHIIALDDLGTIFLSGPQAGDSLMMSRWN